MLTIAPFGFHLAVIWSGQRCHLQGEQVRIHFNVKLLHRNERVLSLVFCMLCLHVGSVLNVILTVILSVILSTLTYSI